MSDASIARGVMSTAASQLGTRSGSRYWDALYPAWDGAPWCATFVRWVLLENGVDWEPSLPFYVPSYESKARAEGLWLAKWATPRAGDLVVYGEDTGAHIGFIEKALADGTIQTIEGNTSAGTAGSQTNGNGVYRRRRSRAWVRGFIRLPLSDLYSKEDDMPSLDQIGDLLNEKLAVRFTDRQKEAIGTGMDVWPLGKAVAYIAGQVAYARRLSYDIRATAQSAAADAAVARSLAEASAAKGGALTADEVAAATRKGVEAALREAARIEVHVKADGLEAPDEEPAA